MKAAIYYLQIQLQTLEQNEAVNRQSGGDTARAAQQALDQIEIRQAISLLETAQQALDASGLTLPLPVDPLATTGLSFSIALAAAKNGKGMWVAVGDGRAALEADQFWNQHTRAFAESNGGVADVLPYLLFKTADGKILMGWLASQTDLLADDWEILVEQTAETTA